MNSEILSGTVIMLDTVGRKFRAKMFEEYMKSYLAENRSAAVVIFSDKNVEQIRKVSHVSAIPGGLLLHYDTENAVDCGPVTRKSSDTSKSAVSNDRICGCGTVSMDTDSVSDIYSTSYVRSDSGICYVGLDTEVLVTDCMGIELPGALADPDMCGNDCSATISGESGNVVNCSATCGGIVNSGGK